MIYQLSDIAKAVRIILDQNGISDQLIKTADIDTLSINEIIENRAIDAVRDVHTSAPYYLLEEGHNFGDSLYWGDLESGYVLLPQDFMRLIVFEMSDWEKPVFAAISANDAEYDLQRQRIKALRGTAQKPVCALVTRPEGKVLEFYSCKSEDAYVRRAQYLPYPKVEDDAIDICERCYPAVIYLTASLVLLTLGEVDKSKEFTEKAKALLS